MNQALSSRSAKASASPILRLLMLTALVFAAGGLGQPVSTAHATVLTIVVDRTDDPVPSPSPCTAAADDCSLREAIITANANPGSTVRLAHGAIYELTIGASGDDGPMTGDLNITANMDFAYPSGLCLYNCAAAIQGGGLFWLDRILSIGPSATVHMPSIIIRNGHPLSGDGGGISNWGALTLNGATLTDNAASNGGGIYNIGILTLTNSSILTNTASANGGGLHNNYPGTTFLTNTVVMGNTSSSNGGGLDNQGTMTMTNSTVKSNTALSGGGIRSDRSLSVSDSTVMSNTASISAGGGIASNMVMTITNTTVSGNTATGAGGGIYTSGSATLTNVAVTNNKTLTGNFSSDGGGIVSLGGNLTLTGSTVSGNSTVHGHGGGIYVQADSFVMTTSTIAGNSSHGTGGGLYMATKTASVVTSTIAGNSMNSTGNVGGGGIMLSSGALTITNSVIGDNGASGDTLTPGGGLFNNYGANLTVQSTTVSGNHAPYGGIFNGGTLTMTNSTVSGNTALTGKGGGLENNGVASLFNSTITNNSAPSGWAGGILNGGTVKLRDTLVAGNSSPSSPDCSSTLVSLGHNLLGISSGCTGLTNGVNGDLVGSLATPLNPKIGPLAFNGGMNATHALLVMSPAINAGDPNPATCPPTDQRGNLRPKFGVCDIGAYELQGLNGYLPLIIR